MLENEFNQPIGEPVLQSGMFQSPTAETLNGRYVILQKLSVEHIEDLYQSLALPEYDDSWTYLFASPIHDQKKFASYILELIAKEDVYYAIINKDSNKAVSYLSLMRVNPMHGSIEVGNVHYSHMLKRSRMATEAQYLLAQYVFETLQYRRYEWKCDNLNSPSKKAALRLGFTYEGLFRKAIIYKGRNRDTAWFAMIDDEWPEIKERLLVWLNPSNFDSNGHQFSKLNP
ncbi:GNAT family N-acetyltransferase [Staphylococcus argenteus]|uniref:GNAT family N-acetyltransferase n=1 Tax=Staphylococcus argenteus TaxID=985002 RepID=UPI000B593282|nr:GNAT family protein [Staphylococcus argenteus]MDR7649956.1 GNAT family protein [Staphylococcus argenteus]MDR7682639.1 GNAT family protein [Staphylococcus argenteus]